MAIADKIWCVAKGHLEVGWAPKSGFCSGEHQNPYFFQFWQTRTGYKMMYGPHLVHGESWGSLIDRVVFSGVPLMLLDDVRTMVKGHPCGNRTCQLILTSRLENGISSHQITLYFY